MWANKYSGHFLDDLMTLVVAAEQREAERAASPYHDQYCHCDWCDDVRRQNQGVSRG